LIGTSVRVVQSPGRLAPPGFSFLRGLVDPRPARPPQSWVRAAFGLSIKLSSSAFCGAAPRQMTAKQAKNAIRTLYKSISAEIRLLF
jgi:hypothetical protein